MKRTATTITTIFYLCVKAVGRKNANQHISTLLSILDIAPVNQKVIKSALQANFIDFEDAVLSESAVFVDADAIVTRNKKDFAKSSIAVYTPEELLNLRDSSALP